MDGRGDNDIVVLACVDQLTTTLPFKTFAPHTTISPNKCHFFSVSHHALYSYMSYFQFFKYILLFTSAISPLPNSFRTFMHIPLQSKVFTSAWARTGHSMSKATVFLIQRFCSSHAGKMRVTLWLARPIISEHTQYSPQLITVHGNSLLLISP